MTYPVCSGLLCLGVKERPGKGVQSGHGKQKLGQVHLGLGFWFGTLPSRSVTPCVADSSDPASGQGLSFLAGLRLTVQHPPYLKLVISFLFISAAIQVPLALALALALGILILCQDQCQCQPLGSTNQS